MADKHIVTPSGREPNEDVYVFRNSAEIRTLATIGLFVMALLAVLYLAKPVLVPVLMALLLYFILRPIHKWLVARGLHQVLAAAMLLIAVMLLLGLGISYLTQPAIAWFERMPTSLQTLEGRLREVMDTMRQVTEVAEQMDDIAKIDEDAGVPNVEVSEGSMGLRVLGVAQQIIAYLFLSVILLFFMLAYGSYIHQRVSGQLAVLAMVEEINHSISTYLLTITVINMALGVAIGLAMYLLGMPNPVLWGAMAALFNFIPYLGAIAGIIIVGVVAVLTFDNTTHIILVPVVYFALTALEGNFITPVVLGRQFTLNPIIIFIWLIFWAWMWGITGGIIAVPLLMAFKIMCDHVQPLKPLSHVMTMDRERAVLLRRRERAEAS